MKQKLLTLLFLILPLAIFSQTVSNYSQDGKIWFKLSNEVRISEALNTNPYNLPLNSIPGFQKLANKYQVTLLSRPFHMAKTSPELQRTYQVEFAQIFQVEDFIKDLQAIKGVEYAEKVPLDHTCLTPNDPSYGSQWGLSIINAPQAWNLFSSGSNVVIAIVDDAVERTHPDLSPNLWVNPGEIASNGIDDDGNGYIDDINGYDVGSNDNNPNPPTTSYDHGTHVAGISSARSNNSTGVASIGFSCKLMCVKSTNTPTAITNGYDGVVYAAANGADVINMSWGGPSYSTTAQNIMNYAWAQGCVLIAAAGNDNVSSQFYPAAYNNVVSVAATTSTDAKASFSNYGSWIDISAPGNNIYSTTVSATYGNKSGTSMASPMVAGLAGLMKSLNPGMTQTDLINCILSTADNINAANPSYIGQLGAGRIDAYAAMNCVSSTLSNPPVADFVANYTTITAGGSVVFTDLSVYNPTTWTWTFTGGTPSSYVGQNPPAITYSTAGLYNVSLTVSNANGSDVETKTSYIQVNPAGGCFSINLPLPATWTPVNYFTGATVGSDGWINGMNVYLDKEKAMYFDASAYPYTYMSNCYVAFGLAYSANPAKTVPVKVYDGTGGTVGALLGTYNLNMGEIMNDVDNGYYTNADFEPAIALPASKRFFVSVDLTNLAWTSGVKDTLSIVSNTNGQSTGYPIWEKQSDNTWYQYGSPASWNLNASLLIHPFLTSQPVNATFTQSATTVCTGEGVSFDAAGSTYQDTLLWVFPGASPNIVSMNPTPSVIFNTPGTHTITMYVVGGGCSELDSAVSTITVNATPSVTVTASQYDICPGGSANLTASGAGSYTWSPSGSLSSGTGASVTATPVSTTTYNVSGTSGSCTGNTTIEITVLNDPTASLYAADTTIDCGSSVMFDGSASTEADAFAWTFASGSPATSNASGELVTYTTPGNFAVDMIVSNICGSDTANFTITVLNNCSTSGMNDDELASITGYYSPTLNSFVLESINGFNQDGLVQLHNELGQVIQAMRTGSSSTQILIPAGTLRSGLYIVTLHQGQASHSFKFIVH